MNETPSNTATLPVPPKAEQPITEGIANAIEQSGNELIKAIAAKHPKVKAKPGKAIVNRTVEGLDWGHLPKGVKYHRKGDTYTVLKGKYTGSKRVYTNDLLVIPTASKLMSDNPGMTQAEAERIERLGGQGVKPGVMAEVTRAGASEAYVVRRYMSKVTDKAHDISVSLHRVNVESTVDKLAREYHLTPEEVRKRLNIKAETTIAA